eukprot:GHRR01005492.1.p1 GENE.GHRR01005492.1~~GHRR01005492.1.p1  ORF type:complete len:384 (+),score=144.45 GHRR01005492.1:94-1245(+)
MDAQHDTAADPPMSPPETVAKVTEDGAVLKHIVTEGSGDPPVLHARCLVHYVGRCIPSNEVFMSTKDDSQSAEPHLIVAGRDASNRETGLNLAAATMKPGERAWVYITDPAYGYGEKGSFSFPSVPPSCQLVYDVQMLTWEPPNDSVERRQMLYEERLEAAERRRLEGNQLFADGKYTEALGKYAMALSYCDEDFMLQLQGPHLDKAEAVTNPVLLNMAAVQLKTGDYATAAHNATQVLMREPKNVKAMFRRAKARAALARTEEAVEDLTVAAALDPDDRQIQRELTALKRTQREEQQATAQLFKGALGPAPKPRPHRGTQAAATAGLGQAAAGSRGLLNSPAAGISSVIHQLLAAIAWVLGWLQRLVPVGVYSRHARSHDIQ